MGWVGDLWRDLVLAARSLARGRGEGNICAITVEHASKRAGIPEFCVSAKAGKGR